MQNSSDPQHAAPGYIESVRSWDNPLESRYVFITIFCILLVGTSTLLFSQGTGVRTFELPTQLATLTTQLSNARVEIQLLQEIELLSPTPDLAALTAAELPPFDQAGTLEPQPGCLVFDLEPYLVRFQQSPQATDGWAIAWLDETAAPEVEHALHTPEKVSSLCDAHRAWQLFTEASI
ncbi:MAG: hypothetical protein AAF529_00360 [Pseudomonadota bacterium]